MFSSVNLLKKITDSLFSALFPCVIRLSISSSHSTNETNFKELRCTALTQTSTRGYLAAAVTLRDSVILTIKLVVL